MFDKKTKQEATSFLDSDLMHVSNSDIKFRASGVGNLMTNARGVGLTTIQNNKLNSLLSKESLTEKQRIELNNLYYMKRDKKPELSSTAKSFVKEMWRYEELGIRDEISSKYLEKGLESEDRCIELLSKFDSKEYSKNQDRLRKGLFTGECDIKTDDKILDIKSCWSAKTFMDSKLSSLYEWQGRVYMELWDKDVFELCYCLVNASESLIQDEIRKVMWKMDVLDSETREGKLIERQVRLNIGNFDNMPIENRVKKFTIQRDKDKFKELQDRAELALEYYYELTLNTFI